MCHHVHRKPEKLDTRAVKLTARRFDITNETRQTYHHHLRDDEARKTAVGVGNFVATNSERARTLSAERTVTCTARVSRSWTAQSPIKLFVPVRRTVDGEEMVGKA